MIGIAYPGNNMHDIIKKYGLPREHVSCPSCGQLFGHHNTKVCLNCEECSKCCSCAKKDFVSVEKFISESEF